MTDVAPIDERLTEFEDIVKGIDSDVSAAAQARDLDLTIGKFSNEINAAGYGHLFGVVQAMASREMIMSIRKIFERTDKKYKKRSIPSALKWIQENKKSVLDDEKVSERLGGCCNLSVILYSIERSLPGKYDKKHLEECKCSSCTLERIKKMADKEVAHNEIFDNSDRPTYRDCDRLIGVARDFFCQLVNPILDPSCGRNDQTFSYEISVVRAATSFRRLMEEKFGLSPEAAFLNRSID